MADILPFQPRRAAAQAEPVAVTVELPAADHAALTAYCQRGGLTVPDALADLARNLAAHVRAPERR